MARTRAAFTMIELVVVAAIGGLLAIVLVPMASRARNAGGLGVSLQNLGTIMAATHMYQADHAGGAPMRACGYQNGQVSNGWDSWNFGGKNCDIYWASQTGGLFDEPAYARPLNAYLYPGVLNVPTGYANTGSGATWHFVHGTPTPQDRLSVQIPVFHSPGDTATRQRLWPNPTPGVSAYDDIGTSYELNMAVWDDPTIPNFNFSAHYIECARRVGLTLAFGNPNFIFAHDQTAEIVYNGAASFQMPGEFGMTNYSVVGFADGRSDYIHIRPGVANAKGYTFFAN